MDTSFRNKHFVSCNSSLDSANNWSFFHHSYWNDRMPENTTTSRHFFLHSKIFSIIWTYQHAENNGNTRKTNSGHKLCSINCTHWQKLSTFCHIKVFLSTKLSTVWCRKDKIVRNTTDWLGDNFSVHCVCTLLACNVLSQDSGWCSSQPARNTQTILLHCFRASKSPRKQIAHKNRAHQSVSLQIMGIRAHSGLYQDTVKKNTLSRDPLWGYSSRKRRTYVGSFLDGYPPCHDSQEATCRK